MISQTEGPDAASPQTSAGGARAGRALAALPRRVLAVFDHWVACLLFWQQIDHDIGRLAALSDGELRRLGLRRNEIVARVYEAARTREDRQP